MFSETYLLRIIKRHPKEFIIAILIIALILQRGCLKQPPPPPKQTVIVETPADGYTPKIDTTYLPADTVHDTIYFWRTKTKNDTVHDTAIITVVPTDTLNIIAAYLSAHIYLDTIDLPNCGKIIIKDSVTRNHIQKRFVEKQFIFQKQQKKNEGVRSLYIGMGVGGYTDKFGAAGKLLYIDKRRNAYGISYNPIQQYIEFSMYWGIFPTSGKR